MQSSAGSLMTVRAGVKTMEDYSIWVREPASHVWHGVSGRPAHSGYRAGCGWDLPLGIKYDFWPVRAGEPGPPEFERCQWCEAARAVR
jgi:hypothetical protein